MVEIKFNTLHLLVQVLESERQVANLSLAEFPEGDEDAAPLALYIEDLNRAADDLEQAYRKYYAKAKTEGVVNISPYEELVPTGEDPEGN